MDIIPLPAHIEQRAGEFQITPETGILHDADNQWNADYLSRFLASLTGYPLSLRTGEITAANTIHLRLDQGVELPGKESYRLSIDPDRISLVSSSTAGIFYGLQSLRQLLPVEPGTNAPVGSGLKIPCLTIRDHPRFSWRGFMLDEGRHFQGKDTVLLTLDLMALQKLNVLHWHLTEDQGWRLEIKGYPRLTQVGSRRPGTSSSMLGSQHDGIPHEGFYTQDEIREIVKYASDRHITIVPEIELPGHCTAALAAYPEFSCTGGPFQVATHFGIFPDIYCAGKESTYTFLKNVLGEVLELFPSPYIHIGGDEAPKKRWKECPDCQRKMHDLGIQDESGLQAWFTHRIIEYLESRGRHAIGWNEILQDGLPRGAVVQYWLGSRKDLIEAIRNDHRAAVMSTYLDAYLDHSYRLMPLSRAYRFDPIPKGLDEKDAASLLGLEFPLWSEWVPSRPRLDYQVYPRLTAMAETGWTPGDKKDFNDFRKRLKVFLRRLDGFGVRYASLEEAEPSRFRRLFGMFSIARPQTKISS